MDGIRYQIFIGDRIPQFSYLCRGMEIYNRLVMRAANLESLDELKMEKSNISVELNPILFSEGTTSSKLSLQK